MMNACSIHINFLSLLFALRLFVICGETACRLCGIEPIAHTLQTSLERFGFLFEGDVYAADRFFRGRKTCSHLIKRKRRPKPTISMEKLCLCNLLGRLERDQG